MREKSNRERPRLGFGLWYYVCMCVPFVLFGVYLLIGTLEPADPYAGTVLPPSAFEPIGFKTPIDKLLKNPPSKEGNAAEIYEKLVESIDDTAGTVWASRDRYGRNTGGGFAGLGAFPEVFFSGMGMSTGIGYPSIQLIKGFTATDEQIHLLIDAAEMRTCEFGDESVWESRIAYATLQDALVRRAKEREDQGETDEAIELYGVALVLSHHLEPELSHPCTHALRGPLPMSRLAEGYGVLVVFRALAIKGLGRCYAARGDAERSLICDRHLADLWSSADGVYMLAWRVHRSPYIASEVLLKHADPLFRIHAAEALAGHADEGVRWVFDIVPYPNAAQQRLALQALRKVAKKETNAYVLEAINDVLKDYTTEKRR